MTTVPVLCRSCSGSLAVALERLTPHLRCACGSTDLDIDGTVRTAAGTWYDVIALENDADNIGYTPYIVFSTQDREEAEEKAREYVSMPNVSRVKVSDRGEWGEAATVWTEPGAGYGAGHDGSRKVAHGAEEPPGKPDGWSDEQWDAHVDDMARIVANCDTMGWKAKVKLRDIGTKRGRIYRNRFGFSIGDQDYWYEEIESIEPIKEGARSAGITDYYDVAVLWRGDEAPVVEHGTADIMDAYHKVMTLGNDPNVVRSYIKNRGTGETVWANGTWQGDYAQGYRGPDLPWSEAKMRRVAAESMDLPLGDYPQALTWTINYRPQDEARIRALAPHIQNGPNYRRGVVENLKDYSLFAGRGEDKSAELYLLYAEGKTVGEAMEIIEGQLPFSAARQLGRGAKSAAWASDPPMRKLKDVDEVTQLVRCSTCFWEGEATATNAADRLPACPSCGSDTLSAAGPTLVNRYNLPFNGPMTVSRWVKVAYWKLGDPVPDNCELCGRKTDDLMLSQFRQQGGPAWVCDNMVKCHKALEKKRAR